MSGFVPRRVSMTKTAMGSTDANSTGKNGHSIVSTLGRRSTLLNKINQRSFGSMFQINYWNARTQGDKCTMEDLTPTKSFAPLQLAKNVDIPVQLFRDNFTTGFVRRSMQQKLVSLYGGGTFTDSVCAFGDVLNNVGDDILLPNDLKMDVNPASDSPISSKKLVAIERWYSGNVYPDPPSIANDADESLGGWPILRPNVPSGNNITDATEIWKSQSIVMVVESGAVLFNQCPRVTINGFQLTPKATTPITNFGGVPVTNMLLILYGGPQSISWPTSDNAFIAGTSYGAGKKINIRF